MIRSRPKLRLASLCSACFFAAIAPAAAEIAIGGAVLSGGTKIAGAQVTLLAAPDPAETFEYLFTEPKVVPLVRVRTGGDGAFELAAPATGFYRILVEAEGFLGIQLWATALTPAPVALGSIELVPARRVRVTLRDPVGHAIAGARIRVRAAEKSAAQGPRWPLYWTTGPDGAVVVTAAQGEEARLVAAASGYALAVVTAAAGQEAAEIRLERGTPVAIEAMDGQRGGLPDVAVLPQGPGMAAGRTDKDGKATVLLLLPGQEKLELFDARGRHASVVAPADKAAQPLRARLEEPRRLSGQVVTAPGLEPIAGAWVFVWIWPPRFTRSDERGQFELTVPPAGDFEVQAVQEGYRRASVPPGDGTPLTLGLEPAARVEGRLRDRVGRGVAGAMVTATANPRAPGKRFGRQYGSTDREGRFLLDEVMAGEPLEIEATVGMQRLPKVQVGPLAAGEKATVELQMEATQPWRCRVVDRAGNAVAGAEVVAQKIVVEGVGLRLGQLKMWNHTWNLARLGKSDARGNLDAELPGPGRYEVAVLAKGFGPQLVQGIQVGGEEPAGRQEIVLQPVVAVRGKVVDAGGQAVAGVRILINVIDDPTRPAEFRVGPGGEAVATTGADGAFGFAELAADQHFYLLAFKEGYLSASIDDVAVESEPSAPLLLTLNQAGRLVGQVKSQGQALPMVHLDLRPAASGGPPNVRSDPRGFSDPQGRYAIEGIVPGLHRLEARGRAGFQDWQSEPFEIASGETKTIDVELEKAVSVFGKVLLPDGRPVADAMVLYNRGAVAEKGVRGPTEESDALGQYRIETASPGQGWLRVHTAGRRELVQPVELAAGTNEIDLVLKVGPLELKAKIVGPDGEPIAGAEVNLSGELFRREKSDAEGAIAFVELEPGKYQLWIDKEGFAFPPREIELKKSAELEWRMEISPP